MTSQPPNMVDYKVIAARKRNERDSAIENALQRLRQSGASKAHGSAHHQNATTEDYISADAAQIVKNIKSGQWTATSVLQAYISQATKAQKAINCLTETLFEEALEQAAVLDAEFKVTHRLRGPLHGVPVSAKDLFQIKGRDATVGYTSWANKPSQTTSEIIDTIREAGGIIFAKTNVPQTMLSFECSNPLWGRTDHPLRSIVISTESRRFRHLLKSKGDTPEDDHLFTCGGSSGGEAALLACDGAALGLGSDIGGSLRIPSGFCGTYAIKTSPGRTSPIGVASPNPDFTDIAVCHGPMGRSIEDIRLGLKVMLGKGQSKDNTQYNGKVASGMLGEKLKFGYYLSDGVVKASPACQRAVNETVKALRDQGHTCTLFTPPDVKEAMRIFVGLTSADGYDAILSHLGDDPQEESLHLVTLGPKLPSMIREAGAWAIDNIAKDETFATSLRSSKRKTTEQLQKVRERHAQYVEKFNREVWRHNQFDGIICPILASPALPHGATKTLSPLAISTFLYNVVPSAVGVVPVTRVDPAKDELTVEWTQGSGLRSRRSALNSNGSKSASPNASPIDKQAQLLRTDPTASSASLHPPESFPTGPHGSKLLENSLYKGRSPVYDAQAMKGLPVGVQIVGRDKDDEKVLEMMRIVDEALATTSKGERDFGPGSSQRYLGKAT